MSYLSQKDEDVKHTSPEEAWHTQHHGTFAAATCVKDAHTILSVVACGIKS